MSRKLSHDDTAISDFDLSFYGLPNRILNNASGLPIFFCSILISAPNTRLFPAAVVLPPNPSSNYLEHCPFRFSPRRVIKTAPEWSRFEILFQ